MSNNNLKVEEESLIFDEFIYGKTRAEICQERGIAQVKFNAIIVRLIQEKFNGYNAKMKELECKLEDQENIIKKQENDNMNNHKMLLIREAEIKILRERKENSYLKNKVI